MGGSCVLGKHGVLLNLLSWPLGHLALWRAWLEDSSLKGRVQGSIPSCSDLWAVLFKNHTKNLFNIQFPVFYSQIFWCSSSEVGPRNLPVQPELDTLVFPGLALLIWGDVYHQERGLFPLLSSSHCPPPDLEWLTLLMLLAFLCCGCQHHCCALCRHSLLTIC